jgi:PAS domain S-box-containing protein
MKIKTKLTLGVGLLFLLIILLGVVGAVYINALKSDTENILEANYHSLEYARNMLIALENSDSATIEKFEINLQKQENNISEIGEEELTQDLRKHFEDYKKQPRKNESLPLIKKDILDIMDMNMQAIQRKSMLAKETANTATSWIALTATLCFLIAFTLLINLPSNIANPIRELTESIQQIAAGNYAERVHFESHNEFGDLARSFNTMANKLEEYNNSNLAKLMMEKKRIETLINNMHDPVIGLDENLKMIFVNEEAIKIIGLKETELIGHFATDIAVRNDLIRLLIQDLMQPQGSSMIKAKSHPLKIYAHDKESYFEKETLHISIIPTGEQGQATIGHVIVLRNITEYKALDDAKTNFIATVSHEFKTPIAAIKMSLQLLANEQVGKLNEEQKNLLSSIEDDAGRLLKITGELLNLSQVESGNIKLAITPADPVEIMNYAISANKTQADQKQVKFEIRCEKNIPKVQADNEKTAWVLTNLISNAIRYSHEHATILLQIASQNNLVVFKVKDTGQGIAPEYKNKIFDRYFQVPGAKREGTGLGLAISKEFIEAQNGQLSVESELGAGSTFTVALNAVE